MRGVLFAFLIAFIFLVFSGCKQFSAAAEHGSPLISENGEVIGIIVSSIAGDRFIQKAGAIPQNVNFAAPAACLPERYLPAARTQTQPQELDRAEMIQRLTESVCLVKAVK